MKRQINAVSAAMAIAIMVTACVGPDGRSRSRVSIQKRWPAGQIRAIHVESTNGNIVVKAGNNSEINMEARVGSRRGMTPEQLEGKYLQTSIHDGTLWIKERRRTKGNVIVLPFPRHSVATDFNLMVPVGTRVTLENINGKLNMQGIEGASFLKSVNGSITIVTPGAEVTARTVNGRVKADFQQRFLGARLKTVNGSIAVSLPPNSSFDCDISQVNGSFRSDVPLVVKSQGRGKNIDASVNGGKFPLELSTVNGSVVVKQRQPDATGG